MAFSLVMLDGMEDKDVEKVKEKIEKVDHVCDVLWYETLADVSLPKEVLPDDILRFLQHRYLPNDGCLLTKRPPLTAHLKLSRDTSIAGEQCFVSGMSSVVEGYQGSDNGKPMLLLSQ